MKAIKFCLKYKIGTIDLSQEVEDYIINQFQPVDLVDIDDDALSE